MNIHIPSGTRKMTKLQVCEVVMDYIYHLISVCLPLQGGQLMFESSDISVSSEYVS